MLWFKLSDNTQITLKKPWYYCIRSIYIQSAASTAYYLHNPSILIIKSQNNIISHFNPPKHPSNHRKSLQKLCTLYHRYPIILNFLKHPLLWQVDHDLIMIWFCKQFLSFLTIVNIKNRQGRRETLKMISNIEIIFVPKSCHLLHFVNIKIVSTALNFLNKQEFHFILAICDQSSYLLI